MNARRRHALLACTERLKRLPAEVHRHPALLFNPWLEGYRDYTFGARAGPSLNVRNLFHELAHAAQFGPSVFRTRATPNGFHFKVRRVWVYDRYCEEARTGQATQRELDTFGHQLHLMQAAGMKVDAQAFADYSAYVMRLMYDWYHVPGENEADRARRCSAQILKCFESLQQKDVVGKLVSWLDATRSRMRRQGKNLQRATHPVDVRYRVHEQALMNS